MRSALLFTPLMLAAALGARAATISVADGEVDFNPGDGRCSLIEAFVNANATGGNREHSEGDCVAGSTGADIISLAPNSMYVLTWPWATAVDGESAGLPAVTGMLVIEGNGAIIAGSTSRNDCSLVSYRLVHVAPGGLLQAHDTEFRGACANGNGGAILNRGTLVASNVVLRGNTVTLTHAGGALFNARDASATLVATTLVDNQSGTSGGAIHSDGALTLAAVTIDGNMVTTGAGGGLVSRGTLVMRESLVLRNHSAAAGGGMDVSGTAAQAADIRNSTITDNRATGDAGGVLVSQNSTYANPAPQVTLKAVTVAGNAGNGGLGQGIVRGNGSSGNLQLSTEHGAAIDNWVLSGPQAPRPQPANVDCVAANASANMKTRSGGCGSSTIGTVAWPLQALADNGGRTATRMPREYAGLVDAGADNASSIGATDQRGEGFPRLDNGYVDAGAVELGAGDLDGDGAIDEHESLAGDGNGDGVADAQQMHVASRPVAVGEGVVTVEVDPSLELFDVAVAPAPLDAPDGAALPFGLVGFGVNGVASGGIVEAVVSFPEDARITGFPVRDELGRWHDIATAVSHGGGRTRVTLALLDGGDTDRDASATRVAVFAEQLRTPAAPASLRVEHDAVAGSVRLRWTAPHNGGSVIRGYVVE